MIFSAQEDGPGLFHEKFLESDFFQGVYNEFSLAYIMKENIKLQ
jgi:hypothetical protein